MSKEIVAPEAETKNTDRTDAVMEISKEIIKIIGRNEVLLGEMSEEERNKAYVPITEEIIRLLIDKDVAVADIDFAFRLALQAFSSFQIVTNNTIERMYQLSLKEKFGKSQIDFTMADIKGTLDE